MLPLYEATAGHSHLADGLKDIKEGLYRNAIWRELVRRDLYNRTKGAWLGKWWIIIGQTAAILGIGLIYGRLFAMEIEHYLPYFATGIITWSYIISLVNEGADVFVQSKGYLTQTRFPLSVCVFRYVARNLILFAYKTSIIFAILLVFQLPVGWSAVIALLGVTLIALAGFFTGVVLGLLNARYRDVGQFVTSLSVVLFFITPVFWKADRLGDFAWVVHYNPLYHFLSLVRSPLIGEPVSFWSFVMTGGAIAILAVVASAVYRIYGREVVYWL